MVVAVGFLCGTVGDDAVDALLFPSDKQCLLVVWFYCDTLVDCDNLFVYFSVDDSLGSLCEWVDSLLGGEECDMHEFFNIEDGVVSRNCLFQRKV